MTYIRVIDDKDASGRLAEVYQEVGASRGKVANIMKVHSLLPETMLAHLNFYKAIMFSSPGLSRAQRELVATVVSKANNCDYCVKHHSEALMAFLKDRFWVNKIVEDPVGADLKPKNRALVDYALKLTREPQKVDEQDVELLRAAGFSEEEVLSVNLVVSYFNFVNRVAMGLGVEYDESEISGYEY